MRIAYLDCFAGISGDMFLGALLEAGVAPKVLHDATSAMKLGASLKIETVDRSGISCTKVHVLEGEKLAEAVSGLPEQAHREPHQHQPKTQHLHKGGHAHTHDHPVSTTFSDDSHNHVHTHEHAHGRSLGVITRLIQESGLHAEVKATASAIFSLLGSSEAKIHNVPVEEIHFHEVGAVDAIVDIVCAAAGIHALGVGKWFASPVNVGGGMVDCAHGRFPVPAPATADLLRGLPTYSAHIQKELVTPTGAAILRYLNPTFGPQPPMRVGSIGYGAGTRNPEGFPNVLRLSVGEQEEGAKQTDQVTVLETAIDDLSPQILAYVTEAALAQGALDVMTTAVQMKKGRMGTLITILADEAHAPALERLLLRETSTLGVRIRQDRRSCLDRAHTSVTTAYGDIRIKVGSRDGEEFNAAPEFEDCRATAARHNVPVKQVMQAATAAYLNSKA
ncbi:nickel pincer cofactor biosynthesis protein LarC [Granulicella sibirica]|uniref:Putative nickel insertion protein n=1 Tax=Granulicella sibirica TaxID=2479048 RepID=A0A4Q0SX16_9BACT|nr:nickel pincer cofactor biosynthesis protein LarC [Granulicella sibirica]RXH54962.1 hypothetical protein GRAN_4066 [Granulicella sibirica]